jgi:hypothetical protein
MVAALGVDLARAAGDDAPRASCSLVKFVSSRELPVTMAEVSVTIAEHPGTFAKLPGTIAELLETIAELPGTIAELTRTIAEVLGTIAEEPGASYSYHRASTLTGRSLRSPRRRRSRRTRRSKGLVRLSSDHASLERLQELFDLVAPVRRKKPAKAQAAAEPTPAPAASLPGAAK